MIRAVLYIEAVTRSIMDRVNNGLYGPHRSCNQGEWTVKLKIQGSLEKKQEKSMYNDHTSKNRHLVKRNIKNQKNKKTKSHLGSASHTSCKGGQTTWRVCHGNDGCTAARFLEFHAQREPQVMKSMYAIFVRIHTAACWTWNAFRRKCLRRWLIGKKAKELVKMCASTLTYSHWPPNLLWYARQHFPVHRSSEN